MKKLIALLLVVMMCFAFVACGDGSGNTETPPSSENCGNNLEKIERGTVTTSENPLLPILFQTLADEGWSYTFNEDGTCGDQVYWWIEGDSENSIGIKICTEYKWKYEISAVRNGEGIYISTWIPNYIDGDLSEWQPSDSYYVDYPTT